MQMYFCLFFQKEFVRLIQGSGVLVVLSQPWIEELYYQVLERNLLGEAGFWGSPDDQTMPLITMLTGNQTRECLKSQPDLDEPPCRVNIWSVQLESFYYLLSDIDGLGSSGIGAQLISKAPSQSPPSCVKINSDTAMAGLSHDQHCYGSLYDNLSFGNQIHRLILLWLFQHLRQ